MLRYVIYKKNGEIKRTCWISKKGITIEIGECIARQLVEDETIERWFIEYEN